MSDIFLTVGVLIPSLAALLIAAFALRRSATDAEEARRTRGEMGLRQQISALRDEQKELKAEIRSLNKKVGEGNDKIGELSEELSAANLKLLRQLLRENGGKQ